MTVKSFLSKMISQISNDYNFHHRSLPRARLSSLQSSILHLSICDKCALPNVIVLHDSQTISFNFFNFQMIITFIIDHFRESDQHFWNHLYFICRSATGGHYQILSCYVMAKSFFKTYFSIFKRSQLSSQVTSGSQTIISGILYISYFDMRRCQVTMSCIPK